VQASNASPPGPEPSAPPARHGSFTAGTLRAHHHGPADDADSANPAVRDLGALPGGELGILATFFGLSLVAGFALKGVFGVTL